MNINWKVRLRSGPFWLGLISLVLTFIYTLLNISLPSLHNHGGLLTHVYENEETIRVPNGTHGGVRDWDFHLAILPTRLSVGIS